MKRECFRRETPFEEYVPMNWLWTAGIGGEAQRRGRDALIFAR